MLQSAINLTKRWPNWFNFKKRKTN